MKLLSKKEAESSLKKQNEDLIETNIRLRKYEKEIIDRLNIVKENYDSDKVKKLKDFEVFCADLQEKKSKILEELMAIQKAVEDKKALYYGLIAKNDALIEKSYKINEQEKRLNLRVLFVEELEKKWKERTLLV